MKKNLLIALIVFTTLDLFSQVGKGNISIAADGNYTKMNSENGVTTNLNYTKGQYLYAGASIGYFFTDKIIAGVGLDYNWDKESRDNKIYFNNFLQTESMNIKSKVLLPNIYLGYYYQIMNKLYLSTSLKFSYGKIKTDINTTYSGAGPYTDSAWTNSSNTTPYVKYYSSNSETKFFSAKIFPEVIYFISTKFGLCVNLGGITYTKYNWEPHDSNLAINFKPAYWRFGIKIRI